MEKFQTIKNMKSRQESTDTIKLLTMKFLSKTFGLKIPCLSENGVIVIGMPKAGNHFMMSVLDAMGCDRAEEIGQEASGGVSGTDSSNIRSHKL